MSAGSAPTPTQPISDPFRELLPWIVEHCSLGDSVRDECYRCGLSAIVHRVLKFGYEEALNRLSARDCLSCCLMCGGIVAEFFLRMAFTRALVEDDQLVVSRIAQTPFIPESRLWLAKLAKALQGSQEEVEEGALWVETMDGEERAIASLLIGRIYQDFTSLEWLTACPLTYPRLAAEIALLLLARSKDHDAVIIRYLRDHPEVRHSVDDQRWRV